MFFSKMALMAVWWTASLATVITEDTGDCAAFPREEASLGQRAMLQQAKSPPSSPPTGVIDDDDLNRIIRLAEMGEGSPPSDAITDSVEKKPSSTELMSSTDSSKDSSTGSSMSDKSASTGDSEKSTSTGDMATQPTEPLPVQSTNLASQVVESCDWLCYINRYPEIQDTVKTIAEAETHWNTVGKSEGKDCTCDASESVAAADGATKSANMEQTVADAATKSTNMEQTVADAATKSTNMEQTVADSATKSTNMEQTVADAATKSTNMEQTVADAATKSTNMEQTVADAATKSTNMENLAPQQGAPQLEAQLQHTAPSSSTKTMMGSMTSCEPMTEAAKEGLQTAIRNYQGSEKFEEKMKEASGESPVTAGHVAIMNYLRQKVLKPGFSVLELGCAAGGMLRFVRDEYDIGWAGVDYADPVPHGALVGVELVPGWVEFAQKNLHNISVFQGDMTEYSLPDPYASKTFDLVMLNDVLGEVQKTRYGCFFSQLSKATHGGSVVYFHAPSPMGLLENGAQLQENVIPHHFLVHGMAAAGFELIAFEHDKDTVCGGEGENLPKKVEGAHCYYNGWPKYVHSVFRRVQDVNVLHLD